jgi:hypothetical protein
MDDYYYRIHVIPSRIDLGNVVREVTEQVEVWNSHLENKSLASIDEVGTNGIDWATGPAPVATYLPTQSSIYDVNIGIEGAAVVNAYLYFNFTTENPALRILGRRVIPLPFNADWSRGFTERFSWLTQVLAARDGTEQRSRLRNYPRRSFRYDVKLMPGDVPLLETALWGWQSRVYGIPFWHQRTELSAQLIAGSTVIPVDTVDRDFGNYAMLWRGSTDYEVVDIDAITATDLTLHEGTTTEWAAGTWVVPMYSGFLSGTVKVDRRNSTMAKVELNPRIEDNITVTETSPPITYLSSPVIDLAPNWIEGFDDQWVRDTRRLLDSQTGGTSVEDVAPRPALLKDMRWDFTSRADAIEFMEYLNWTAGRLNVVWIESGTFDFNILNTLTSGAANMNIDWIGYTNLIDLDDARKDVVVALKDGTKLRRRIQTALNNGDGTESLAMDTTWGQTVDVSDIKYASYLSPYRMESDSLEYLWHDREKMTVRAIFRVIPQ